MIGSVTRRLTEQNQLRGWLDCEARGMRHQLGRPHEVRSAYAPVDNQDYTTVRQCHRCPVRVMSVPRAD